MKTRKPIPLDPVRLTRSTVAVDRLGREWPTIPPEERLKRNVPNWGQHGVCWVWTAGVNAKGYGVLGLDGRHVLTHRVSYALHYGTDPGDLRVLHRCENPPCVNPQHLFQGTSADNTADMLAKGRHVARKHEENGKAKLTDAQAQEIRWRAARGETKASLAAEFGIHPSHCGRVVRGLRWVD